jgi:hypothetical protein
MNGEATKTIFVSIGNSDDKLSQEDWSLYVGRVNETLQSWADNVHGNWRSLPDDPWQNACWAVEFGAFDPQRAKVDLEEIAREFDQDSILWAEAQVEFISYGGDVESA